MNTGTSAEAAKHILPYGDQVGMHFNTSECEVLVEMEAIISEPTDCMRGIYQCVKYQAVAIEQQVDEGKPQNSRAILALEGELPRDLVALKNTLGIEIVQSVSVPQK